MKPAEIIDPGPYFARLTHRHPHRELVNVFRRADGTLAVRRRWRKGEWRPDYFLDFEPAWPEPAALPLDGPASPDSPKALPTPDEPLAGAAGVEVLFL